jgi:hypothetical protein
MDEKPKTPPPRRGCGAWGIALVPLLMTMALALCAATWGGNVYVRQVQAPRCDEYARKKQLSDLDYLEFRGVVIATGQHHGHICQFTDTRTGAPVSLEFDDADIPALTDTLQVLCGMVAPFLTIGLGLTLFWSWLAKRTGLPLDWGALSAEWAQSRSRSRR